MPAMHLISVVFPAPLSPTSAVTSPARTTKSTSCSTWTGPKLLFTPRSCRIGSVNVCLLPAGRSCAGAAVGAAAPAHERLCRVTSGRLDAELVAGGLERRDADLRGLHGTVVDHLLDVVLRDQLRREQHGLDVAVALRVLLGGRGERVG